ncbi:hypothetical protein [Actinokineospora sp. HUAS TT18]|uniref:hypothetical protein n=1 Tax=Actinokineospora sp. HUAS TT18 TaxID=3447451 RepID=UPI003F523FBE
MSWQEDLRKLDDELATGRISADEYRVRRDQLLADATSLGDSRGQQRNPSVTETQIVAPVNPSTAPPSPDNPDQTQIVSGPSAAGVDRTQVVGGHGQPTNERTQVVGGWQTARPPMGDAERTQVVPGVPPQSWAGPQHHQPPHQGGYSQQPPNSPWGQQPEEAPLWSGAEFPPLAPTGSTAWTKQGPEIFDDRPSSKRWIAIVGAVVVLALIGAGVYFFAIKPSGDNRTTPTAQPSSTAAAPTTTKEPDDGMPVADLGGSVEDHKYVKDFTDVPKAKFLTQEELAAYQAANPGKSKFAVFNQPDGAKEAVLLITATPATAAAARDALGQLQVKYGFTARAQPPAGVVVAEIAASPEHPAIVRGHYASDGIIVRLEVQGKDLATVVVQFNDMMAAQLQELPADV